MLGKLLEIGVPKKFPQELFGQRQPPWRACLHPQPECLFCNKTLIQEADGPGTGHTATENQCPICKRKLLRCEKLVHSAAKFFHLSTAPGLLDIYSSICPYCQNANIPFDVATTATFNCGSTAVDLPLLLHIQHAFARGSPPFATLQIWRDDMSVLYGAEISDSDLRRIINVFFAFLAASGQELEECPICRGSPRVVIMDANAKLVTNMPSMFVFQSCVRTSAV